MIARLKLATILILFEIVSDYFLRLAPSGDMYYLIAGAFSFLIIPTIARVGCDQLAIDLLIMALIMLMFQFIGLITYHSRLPVEIYNWPVHGLVLAQFIRLIIVRGNDGVDRHTNFVHLLCSPNSKRGGNLC